jgi:hypothetical protein
LCLDTLFSSNKNRTVRCIVNLSNQLQNTCYTVITVKSNFSCPSRSKQIPTQFWDYIVFKLCPKRNCCITVYWNRIDNWKYYVDISSYQFDDYFIDDFLLFFWFFIRYIQSVPLETIRICDNRNIILTRKLDGRSHPVVTLP